MALLSNATINQLMIDNRKELKLYIDFSDHQSMGKDELIETIGRAIVDENFRRDFAANPDSAVNSVKDLEPEEKDFLKDHSNEIRDLATALSVKYFGESKRN